MFTTTLCLRGPGFLLAVPLVVLTSGNLWAQAFDIVFATRDGGVDIIFSGDPRDTYPDDPDKIGLEGATVFGHEVTGYLLRDVTTGSADVAFELTVDGNGEALSTVGFVGGLFDNAGPVAARMQLRATTSEPLVTYLRTSPDVTVGVTSVASISYSAADEPDVRKCIDPLTLSGVETSDVLAFPGPGAFEMSGRVTFLESAENDGCATATPIDVEGDLEIPLDFSRVTAGSRSPGADAWYALTAEDPETLLVVTNDLVIDVLSDCEGDLVEGGGGSAVIRLGAGETALVRITNPDPCDDSQQTIIFRSAHQSFLRGDANVDGDVDIADAGYTLAELFLGEGIFHCQDAADSNDDGAIDLSDAVNTLSALFLGTVEIPLPGTEDCGPDPSVDDLPTCAPTRGCNPA